MDRRQEEHSVLAVKDLAHVMAIQVSTIRIYSCFNLNLFLGGGFFVKIGSSWTLKGIVSASTLDKKTGQCDVGKYALFTRVVKFNDWIEAIIGLE